MTLEEVRERNRVFIELGAPGRCIPETVPALHARVLTDLSNYNAQRSGISYAEMGYALPDGSLPGVLVIRHKLIHNLVKAAEAHPKRK